MSGELAKAKQTVSSLQKHENELKEKLTVEQRKKRTETCGTVASMDKRPASLVRKYGELYAQTRLDTLDCLDSLKELNNNDDLKSKLLFSVIVVSFKFIVYRLLISVSSR